MKIVERLLRGTLACVVATSGMWFAPALAAPGKTAKVRVLDTSETQGVYGAGGGGGGTNPMPDNGGSSSACGVIGSLGPCQKVKDGPPYTRAWTYDLSVAIAIAWVENPYGTSGGKEISTNVDCVREWTGGGLEIGVGSGGGHIETSIRCDTSSAIFNAAPKGMKYPILMQRKASVNEISQRYIWMRNGVSAGYIGTRVDTYTLYYNAYFGGKLEAY